MRRHKGPADLIREAVDGSTGVADLELVDNRTMRGSFANYSYGTKVNAVLRR